MAERRKRSRRIAGEKPDQGTRAAKESREHALVERSLELLAYGGHHRALLRPLYEHEEGAFPHFAVSGRGWELIDSEGRSYVDWINGFGSSLLGYRRPEVEEAIVEQFAGGPTLPLLHPIELEVAATLTEMIPCAEMVAFGKSGSDVLTAAVRLAKAVTGRELILQHGFHGWHDWYTCQYRDENSRGVPKVLRAFIHQFPYNDVGAVEGLLERFSGEVAAVLMEPLNIRLPKPGYLDQIRDLAHRHGALLVFDEVVTGFRLANGGAQEAYRVTPDLACFGKGLANGMPLSVLVGRREYMEKLPNTAYGMTFRDETFSLAAARAVLRILKDEPVTEHLARIGEEVRAGFHDACARHGIHAELSGPPARMTFSFNHHGAIPFAEIKTRFLIECAKNGVLSNGNLLATYAHDAEAVERTIEGLEAALASIAAVVQEGTQAVHDAVVTGFEAAAEPNGAEPKRLPAGHIDVIGEEGEKLGVWGWLLFEDGGPDAVELVSASGESVEARLVDRTDIAAVYPDVEGATRSGYAASLPMGVFAHDGRYEFTIRALKEGREVFRCRLERRLRSPSSRLQVPFRDDRGVLHV